MAKYSQYIEISPDYESVVDLSSEQRHPDMWMSYIVHEDMADAIDKITQSLKNENKDAVHSGFMVLMVRAKAMRQSF